MAAQPKALAKPEPNEEEPVAEAGDEPPSPEPHEEPSVREAQSSSPQAVPLEGQSEEAAVAELAIGIDFGTSTTQVAVRIGQSEPELLELEPGLDHIPSYVAIRSDGTYAFGSEARNLPLSVHSLKPLLVEDLPLADLGGVRPSDLAHGLLAEVVRRTLSYLKAQRLIPESLDRLSIATNLGTTARFDLQTRSRLRDVATAAGVNVRLADLVEEPLAAAYELIYGGTATDGGLMVVDIGGGTLDVAVVRSDLGSGKFELFATRGARVAGDRFTEVIVREIEREVAELTGSADPLDRASATLVWSRAETAKLDLSSLNQTTVALGGIGGLDGGEIEFTSGWFADSCRRLRAELLHEIREAYRTARLSLGRGGKDDPYPGTMRYRIAVNGKISRLTEIDLATDAREHLGAVIAVGGGSQAPMVRRLLEAEFGALVQDSFVDPVGAIALGLARTRDMTAVNLRYPGWGISMAIDGSKTETPLYEPYAPTMKVRGGDTAEYSYTVEIPKSHPRSVQLIFKPIGTDDPVIWAPILLPSGTRGIRLDLNLLGRLDLWATHEDGSEATALTPGRDDLKAPWTPPEGELVAWLPKSTFRNDVADVNEWRWDGGG